jgi:hypothetical protein
MNKIYSSTFITPMMALVASGLLDPEVADPKATALLTTENFENKTAKVYLPSYNNCGKSCKIQECRKNYQHVICYKARIEII